MKRFLFRAVLRRLSVRLLAFCGLVLAMAIPADAAELVEPPARDLFLDVPAPGLNVKARLTVSRRRVVTVDTPALRQAKAHGAKLRINLFADKTFEGEVQEVLERGGDQFTLLGHLRGQPNSSFAVSMHDGVSVMNVRTEGELFQLRHLENSFYDVRQVDENKFPPCGTTGKHAVSPPADPGLPGAKNGAGTPAADSGAVIDVMVVYTAASRAAAGGTAAIQALINLAIDESNVAFQRSQITPRLRLVHRQEVAYTEVSFETDLNRLTGTSDGYLDNVHALRNTHGADMVCMFIDDSEYCGLAWLMTSLSAGFASSAFSVVYWDCAAGYYTLAHELGHNMGCNHDRQNANQALYSYSYGWRFVTAGGITNRTVMAYAPGNRIQNFSNPDVFYNGVPTGVPVGQPNQANNALSINNAAFTVANWRQSVSNCNYLLNPSLATVGNAPSTGTVAVTVGAGCPWSAVSQSAFITLSGNSSGTGNGSFTFVVATNAGSTARTGTVSVAGQMFTVIQNPLPPPPPPVIPLAIALEVPGANLPSNGVPWFGQATNTHDGVDAGRSGAIPHNGQSAFELGVTGPGTLTFWWKVSSEGDYDFLRVLVDGVEQRAISGERNWERVAIAVPDGPHTVTWIYAKDATVTTGQDAAWVDRIQLPLAGFSIRSLGGVGTTLDHAAVTGDDRGGIAASSTSVFANGDTAAARFGIENLSGAGAMGQVMDGLVSDLRTETVYLLANNNTAISGGANGHVNTTVNRLLELTSLGTLSGRSIPLSHGIPVNGTNAASGPQCGVFAGYGQVVIYNRTNVFSISLPSGQVNDLGTMAEPPHVNSEGWAYWGVAEYFSNAVHVVHVSNPTTIARTQVPGGVTSTVSSFSNLGDMAGFTVSIPRGRWYYRYEGTSQFGTFPEALGFAGARFGGVSSGYFLSGGTARLLGNRVVLEFRGPPMTTAVLQGSTNMSAWSPLATNVLSPSGEWRYTNDMLGVPRRFFRAIIP